MPSPEKASREARRTAKTESQLRERGGKPRRMGDKKKARNGHENGEGSFRDEQVLEGAGIAGFFEAMIESVEGGVEIVQKDETDKGEGEVAAALRESLLESGAVDEARDVIEGGGTEKGLDGFDDKHGAIGARNG